MFIVQKNLEKIKNQFNVDRLSHTVIAILLIFFTFKAIQLYRKPINEFQYQHVVELALQAQFPQTQQFAQQSLLQRQINTVTYLKLIYAQHFESSKIRQQPSLQLDELGQVQQ